MAKTLLRIPRTQVAALARLIALEPAQHEALSIALRESKASLSIRSLATQIADKAGFGREDAYDLIRVLAMLYSVRDREGAGADFLSEVESAAKQRAELAAADWGTARQRIGELLSHSHSLGVTAKASDVLNEHACMFCDARVLTDVRPVFAADVKQPPDALIVVHELRISYHQDADLKAIYVAMDSIDVQELRDALDRALRKEASLQKLADTGAVPILKATSGQR